MHRTFRRSACALTAGLALLIGSAVTADAGSPPPPLPTPDPTLTVSPTTVTYGTTMTVSGGTCVDGQTGSGEGLVVLVSARSLNIPNELDPTGARLGLADVEADGSWTFTYTVPAEAPNFTFPASFGRNVQAWCAPIGPGQGAVLEYDSVPITFDVPVAAPVTSPTSVPAGPPPSEPTPATPLPGAATFTG